MSARTLSLAAATLLILAGCATTPGAGGASTSGWTSRYERLQAQCLERKGILQPTGANRGDPALDYACIINNPGPEILKR